VRWPGLPRSFQPRKSRTHQRRSWSRAGAISAIVTGDLRGQAAKGIAQEAQDQGDGVERQRQGAAKPAANSRGNFWHGRQHEQQDAQAETDWCLDDAESNRRALLCPVAETVAFGF
jgi:hypothetical protein